MPAIRQRKPSKQPILAAARPNPAIHRPSDNGVERSLQINIDSKDDAKAVIQNLPAIKKAWDFAKENNGITSVEFCIAADIRRDVDAILIGAIRWCRTYIKQVAPFEGNVLFPLPHYREHQVTVATEPPPAPAPVTVKPEKVNRYLRNLPTEPQPLGNAQRLVSVDASPG